MMRATGKEHAEKREGEGKEKGKGKHEGRRNRQQKAVSSCRN